MEGSHHCLSEGWTLPIDRAEAQKLQHMAIRYIHIGDLLYKKSYSKLHPDPYLRCLGPDEARRTMEIHDGECGTMLEPVLYPRSHQSEMLLAQDVR